MISGKMSLIAHIGYPTVGTDMLFEQIPAYLEFAASDDDGRRAARNREAQLLKGLEDE
jgi:hypothetical protein